MSNSTLKKPIVDPILLEKTCLSINNFVYDEKKGDDKN